MLNGLVHKLSVVIKAAAADANQENGGEPRVHFVQVNPRFDAHRFCEDGDSHEPDQDRQATWYFLGDWKDVSNATGPASMVATIEEVSAVQDFVNSTGSIKLPDPETCSNKLGSDPDPWDVWQCRMAHDVKRHPNGFNAKNLEAANKEIAAKNTSGHHIKFFMPNQQLKTFHPRTPGMLAYRDALIDSINLWQTPKCDLAIQQYWTCEPEASNLRADVWLRGRDEKTMLYSTKDLGEAPNITETRLRVREPGMDESLDITGHHDGDFIEFAYGTSLWKSSTLTGDAACELVGKDWDKAGPSNCKSNPNVNVSYLRILS
jgi:hypothetical protein